MKDNAGDDTVLERLEGALDAEALPQAARDYARHLVRRLSQPVRVSVLGLPGSGKSQLVNMFLGEKIVPDGATLPTTEYAYGEEAQMVITGADGGVVRVHGSDVASVSGSKPAFLRVELPIEILQRINLLEVVTDGSSEELTSGVDWVVRRTDIALWCTQEFGKPEQAIWRRVPDSLKDHAFLVLSKADLLSAKSMLRETVSALETVVAEEFHSLFAVATMQALRAFRGDAVDEAMFHASGGGALTSEVLRHAERGRRADFDSAHMFLARYQVEVPASPKAVTEVSAKDAAEEPPVLAPMPHTTKARSQRITEEAPVIEAVPPVPAQEPEVESASVVPPAVAISDEPDTPKVENVALFTDAIRFLRRRGETLAETASSLGEGSASGLISHCVSAVEHLVDQFTDDDSGCAAADAFIDELAEAQDMMVLMQVEDSDGPAADAVTLLLQLRRDMEMQLAA